MTVLQPYTPYLHRSWCTFSRLMWFFAIVEACMSVCVSMLSQCVCVSVCPCCELASVDNVRPRLRQELHGFTYLIEVLDLTLRSAEEEQRQLNDQHVDLCCEVLKILFNVTVGMEATSLDEVSTLLCVCGTGIERLVWIGSSDDGNQYAWHVTTL